MREKAVLFGKFRTLAGILTEPDLPVVDGLPAVILSNAGMIHRIGPNRIYVKLARDLAMLGFPVLRFDISGIGDSATRPDHMPVEEFTIDDVKQAMDYLAETLGSRQFVLGGHCAGAYHSIRTTVKDPRVSGVIMINPDGGEAEWKEYDQKRKLAQYYENYYGRKTLLDPQRWKRFFTAQVSYRSVFKNIFKNVIWNRLSALYFRIRQRLRAPRAQVTVADEHLFNVEAIVRKLPELSAKVLLVYSESSTSLERVQMNMGKELKRLQADGKLQLSVIPGADHLYSPLASQACLFQTVAQWMQNIYQK